MLRRLLLRPFYRCVVRLHPPAFRERFADEMLSIFDRSVGTQAELRLLLDALLSLARQWALRPEFWHGLPQAPTQPSADGIPSFQSLDPFRPRTAAVIHALVLSTVVFSLTCFAIRYSWIHVLTCTFGKSSGTARDPCQAVPSRPPMRQWKSPLRPRDRRTNRQSCPHPHHGCR